jgi:cytoskeletal protein CcmA (bactofilin family)
MLHLRCVNDAPGYGGITTMQPHLSWLVIDRFVTALRHLGRSGGHVPHRWAAFQPVTALAGVADAEFDSEHMRGSGPRWRDMMVFRKESRADSFQRQISALRQQLGSDQEDEELYPVVDDAEPMLPGSSLDERMPSPRTISSSSADESAVGIIAANSHWNGTMRSDGSLSVLGRVEGELIAADEIYIAEGASVEARVSAAQVIIAGSVNGTVECTTRLEVLPSGHVVGDVTSPTLIVHEGATVEGDLSMRAPVARPA